MAQKTATLGAQRGDRLSTSPEALPRSVLLGRNGRRVEAAADAETEGGAQNDNGPGTAGPPGFWGNPRATGQRNGVDAKRVNVIRRRVPDASPTRRASFFAKQEWAGRVTAIRDDEFDARLRDMADGERDSATIDLGDISQEDRAQLRVGSLFHFVMGYQVSTSGTMSHVWNIVFMEPPRLTERDLERGRRWADWLHERWGSE